LLTVSRIVAICAEVGPIATRSTSPEGAPTMTAALAAGGPVDAATGSIAVDSLAPRRIGELTFAVISRQVQSVVLVSDDAIGEAQRMLWERLRIVAEPGGSAALAALISGRYQPEPGEHVAVVLSGANTIAVDFGR
jgi:threonine dehydratase